MEFQLWLPSPRPMDHEIAKAIARLVRDFRPPRHCKLAWGPAHHEFSVIDGDRKELAAFEIHPPLGLVEGNPEVAAVAVLNKLQAALANL